MNRIAALAKRDVELFHGGARRLLRRVERTNESQHGVALRWHDMIGHSRRADRARQTAGTARTRISACSIGGGAAVAHAIPERLRLRETGRSRFRCP